MNREMGQQSRSKSRNRICLDSRLERNLLAYSVAAGAACACSLYAPPAAEAKVVYKPVHMRLQHRSAFPLYFTGDRKANFFLVFNYIYEDEPKIDSLAVCHKPYKTNYGYQCDRSGGTSNALNAVRVNASGFASALKAGAKIQKGDHFINNAEVSIAGATWSSNTYSTRWFGPWANKGRGVRNRYVGMKLHFGGAFHFGWARLSVGRASRGFFATLTGYAYEAIPGKGIVAGQTHNAGNGDENKFVSGASLGGLALGAPSRVNAIHGNK